MQGAATWGGDLEVEQGRRQGLEWYHQREGLYHSPLAPLKTWKTHWQENSLEEDKEELPVSNIHLVARLGAQEERRRETQVCRFSWAVFTRNGLRTPVLQPGASLGLHSPCAEMWLQEDSYQVSLHFQGGLQDSGTDLAACGSSPPHPHSSFSSLLHLPQYFLGP